MKVLDRSVELVPEVQNVIVTMYSRLRFEYHIAKVLQNCLFRLKVILYINCNFLGRDLLVHLCESLTLPKLNYCLSAFCSCLWARMCTILQQVQNVCARFCFPIPPRSHATYSWISLRSLQWKMKKLNCIWLCYYLLFLGLTYLIICIHGKLSLSSKVDKDVSACDPPAQRCCFRGRFRYLAATCWNKNP